MNRPVGRPRRYAEYDALVASLKPGESRRPKYVKGIGVLRGMRGDTAWIKIRLRKPATFKGRSYKAGDSIEIKLGKLESWGWEELADELKEYQRRADQGQPLVPDAKPLFEDWANDWLARAKGRLKSFKDAKYHVSRHFIPAFGKLTIDEIKPSHINSWMKSRLKTVKSSSVRRELDTLKSIFNNAIQSDLLEKNPCDRIDSLRAIPGRSRVIKGDEMISLLARASEAYEPWFFNVMVWALHSGMRRSEILNLAWSDVQEASKDVVLVTVRNSKTGSFRTFPCTRTMRDIVKKQKADKKTKDQRVFPISDMTLKRRWASIRNDLGLEDIVFHDFRRTNATHAAISQVDLRSLASRLGHSNLAMIERHYATVVEATQSRNSEKIEEALGRLTGGT